MKETNKKNPSNGILDSFDYDVIDNDNTVTDMSQMNTLEDVDDDNDKTEPDPNKGTEENEDGTTVISTEGNARQDSSEIPEDVLNRMNNKTSNNETSTEESEDTEVEDNDNTTVDPGEAQQVGAFFDAFAEALNWDVDEKDKPKSIEEIIDYIGDVVELNSTPKYADDRIAQLDQYVKNGGKFEDFYSVQQQRLEYEGLDMEDESNQKAVVRDYMKMQGYTDEQINRKIERYEDADMLEDEAADAVGYLKRVREQQLQQAQAELEQLRLAQEKQAMEFMNSLNESIGSLTNIRGISIPKEDRKALLDYITRIDADGLTQYQKDFQSNMVNNLIESAYFTMKGDALLGTATRNGQTSAASKLRTLLKHQLKNHSSISAQEEKTPQMWEMASKFL